MNYTEISLEAILRRQEWIEKLIIISESDAPFTANYEKMHEALQVQTSDFIGLLEHVRLCGAIPERFGHDSSVEKLYSKYTDALLSKVFRFIGLESLVLTERADAADVEVVGPSYSFVADAKAFRLSRTAKNQKDFKVASMDKWKRGKQHALVVCPLYQLPSKSSQIYNDAIVHEVCILSYYHLAVLISFRQLSTAERTQVLLERILETVISLHPGKEAYNYWIPLNQAILHFDQAIIEPLWHTERKASLESIDVVKQEALTHLAQERARILSLSKEEAINQLLNLHKIESRLKQIERIKADLSLVGVEGI